MNYILIMTEGTDEKAFLDVLLEKGMLKYKKEELLFDNIYHKRQIDNELKAFIQQLSITDQVTIYRVGDKLSDELKIPKDISLYTPKKIKEIIDNPEPHTC